MVCLVFVRAGPCVRYGAVRIAAIGYLEHGLSDKMKSSVRMR